MPITLGVAAVNMAVALACGAVIGSERQVRQRMAGLRTNALVSLGAAGFVVFSQLVINDASPTRVAAQVVSGIGFLGAGIIFRDGFNVHGLNTAATLWCSAAVGVLAGIGAWQFAGLLTAMVVFVNLGLRPLVKWLKRHTTTNARAARQIKLVLTCLPEHEAAMRLVLVRSLALGGLHILELACLPGDDGLELQAVLGGEELSDHAVEQAVQRLAAEPGLRRIRWMAAESG